MLAGIEYQKSFAALMLLWKGIAEYVSRHPRYCRLIGPVSISNDYLPLSRELLVGFLRKKNFDPLAPTLVRPRTPFRGRFSVRSLGGHKALGDIDTFVDAGIQKLSEAVNGTPIVRAVDEILTSAAAARASDVHIEPFAGGGRVRRPRCSRATRCRGAGRQSPCRRGIAPWRYACDGPSGHSFGALVLHQICTRDPVFTGPNRT